MIITKYGDLNCKTKFYRVKFHCPVCGTKGLLDKEDYTLIKDLKILVKDDLKNYGKVIKYTCPMCEAENTEEVKTVSKLKEWWWRSNCIDWEIEEWFEAICCLGIIWVAIIVFCFFIMAVLSVLLG